MTASTDIELLSRLLAGERRTFHELVGVYQDAMWAVAWAIIGKSHTEEVVQGAQLVAVRGLDGFQGHLGLKTRLLTIAANTAKSRLRQVCREVFPNDLSEPHGAVDNQHFVADGYWNQPPHAWHENSPKALFTKGELRDYLDKTLNGLSELQHSVLTLRERQGLKLEEARDLLDIILSNARVLLHRAHLKVFTTLEYLEEIGQC